MASTTVYERIALYDNSRKDENGRDCYIRLPWNVVTMSPGLTGEPRTTFLEPIAVNLSAICGSNFSTAATAYHGVSFVDAKSVYVPGNHGTGGENRVDV